MAYNVPIIRRLEEAVVAEAPITLSDRDARVIISVMESTRDTLKVSRALRKMSNRLWFMWLIVGFMLGLALPRILFVLHYILSMKG